MKKIISILLAVLLVAFSFAACSNAKNETKTDDTTAAAESDLAYVQEKGKLIIGITYFEPMDYIDKNGELTGFEVEFGKAVCEKLGVTPEFQEINWEAKETELSAKNIDSTYFDEER